MQSLAVGLVIENKAVADETLTCLRGLSVRILFQDSQAGDWTDLSGRLEQLRPDAVLMDLAALGENWEETIRSVRRLPGSPPVMILHTSTDPQIILRAMRAGACEYLSTPVSSNLKEALERIAAERTRAARGLVRMAGSSASCPPKAAAGQPPLLVTPRSKSSARPRSASCWPISIWRRASSAF